MGVILRDDVKCENFNEPDCISWQHETSGDGRTTARMNHTHAAQIARTTSLFTKSDSGSKIEFILLPCGMKARERAKRGSRNDRATYETKRDFSFV